jgi:hypothetical protein
MATVYEQTLEIRNNLTNALLQDSLNPSPDYSVGGQSVSRVAWRESLMRQINELNKLLSIYNPIEYRNQIY